jgi:hypothetical protein
VLGHTQHHACAQPLLLPSRLRSWLHPQKPVKRIDDLLQARLLQVQVDAGGLEVAMPEQPLNDEDIRAGF